MGKDNGKINATFKSKDTEEWLDVVFTRKVGYVIALLCEKLRVHPNTVTIISVFLGVSAGLCLLEDDMTRTLCGIGLLMTANFLDSADGQLARMTGQQSRLGRLLDGLSGDAWFIAIYLCICFRLAGTPMPFCDGRLWNFSCIFALAAVSGLLFHVRQAALADYYRNAYLLFHGDASELCVGRELAMERRQLTWKKDWPWKIGLFFYGNYTRVQELMTPCFQKLRSVLKEKYADEIPVGTGQRFCSSTFRLLKWTNILTFNTRAIVLYITLLAGMPWLYFIFEMTVMELIFIYMRRSHEKACRSIAEEI